MSGPGGRSIRLSAHALGYQARRGFTVAEVEETVRASPWILAREGRLEASREFPYQGVWDGTFYATKKVRAIFIETPNEIVVITVYTYYF